MQVWLAEVEAATTEESQIEAFRLASEYTEILRYLGGTVSAGANQDGLSLLRVELPDDRREDPNALFMDSGLTFNRLRGAVNVPAPVYQEITVREEDLID